MTVTTYKVVTGFTVSGATLTVAASTAARTLVVNRPAEQRTYFGGEAAFEVIEDSEGKLVLRPSFQRQDAGVYDPVSHAAVVDPFGIQLTYDSTDPLVHFAGDPALHTAGEVERYLGGEPIVDELGRPVLNADGSYWTALAGQAVIHNRRDLAFAPDYLSFTYDANDLTLDLGSAALHFAPNAGVAGWTLDFDRAATAARPYDAPDRVVAVVVRSDKGVFALYEGAGFTLDKATGVLTLGAIDPSRIAGTVELTVTLALQLVHRTGDVERWFGDEEVANGDPVVLQQGGNFVLSFAEDGVTVLTYTSSATVAASDATKVFWLDSRGNHILQKRGAPVFELVSGQWQETPAVAGTPVRLVGNEPVIYFGGERVYYAATDAKQDARDVHRLTFDSPSLVAYFTDRTFPNTSGQIPATTTSTLNVTLNSGVNTFTIVGTHAGTTNVSTGAGNDRVAVRSIVGPTNVDTGANDDVVYVGSEAGLWGGNFSNVNGDGNASRRAHDQRRHRHRPRRRRRHERLRRRRRHADEHAALGHLRLGRLDGVLGARTARHPPGRRADREQPHDPEHPLHAVHGRQRPLQCVDLRRHRQRRRRHLHRVDRQARRSSRRAAAATPSASAAPRARSIPPWTASSTASTTPT